ELTEGPRNQPKSLFSTVFPRFPAGLGPELQLANPPDFRIARSCQSPGFPSTSEARASVPARWQTFHPQIRSCGVLRVTEAQTLRRSIAYPPAGYSSES